MAKKIIIIGGGISGLTAGITAQLNGYDSLILEKNPILGGLCTGWDRKGRHIDGCVHWLTGTKEGTSLYNLWTSIGAFKSQDDLIYLPTWGSFTYEGTTVTFYKGLDKAEQSWIDISKEDTKSIKYFFKMVRKVMQVDLPLNAPALLLPWKIKMKLVGGLIKTFPYYTKGMHMSCEKFAKRFKHPALRWALTHVQPGAGNLYSMMYSYATIASNNGGIPKGGSKKMIENIKDKYLSLGGQISLNSEVTSINVDKKKITYLTLKNGTKVVGDYYVSCCDGNYVLINLLKNKYPYPKLAERYNRPDIHPSPSCVLINYEVPVNKDINIPSCFHVQEFSLGLKKIDAINVRAYSYDESFIKNDKTILQVLVDQDSMDYDYWCDLYKDKAKYNAFKQDFASFIRTQIENEYPIYKGNMTLLDVATPITLNRYVNASRGSYMSFLFNHKKGVINTRGRIYGIHNMYLSGQYMQTPGGLPLAAASGLFSIQWIKQKESKLIFRILNLFKLS